MFLMRIQNNINIRKRAFKLTLEVIKFVDSLPKCSSTFVIGKQLIASSSSIGANTVEAKSSASKKEFINFYNYSLKSANESIYWLYLLKELYPLRKKEIEPFINETNELSNMLASSILTMKKSLRKK